MNETHITDDRDHWLEGVVEKIAGIVAEHHGLGIRVWTCADERRETLASVCDDAARHWHLTERQEAFLRACVNDLAAKFVEPVAKGAAA
jgi:hypothetical protein